MPYADLLESIIPFLSADATLKASAPGGVWADEAPADAVLPFVVVSDPSGDVQNESGGNSIETAQIQVAIYAEDKGVARSIRRYVGSLLSDSSQTFTAGTLLHLRSTDRLSSKDPDRGPGGGDVWQEVQLFDAVIGHS